LGQQTGIVERFVDTQGRWAEKKKGRPGRRTLGEEKTSNEEKGTEEFHDGVFTTRGETKGRDFFWEENRVFHTCGFISQGGDFRPSCFGDISKGGARVNKQKGWNIFAQKGSIKEGDHQKCQILVNTGTRCFWVSLKRRLLREHTGGDIFSTRDLLFTLLPRGELF